MIYIAGILTALILTCVGFELHDRRKAREWDEWEKAFRRQNGI